MQKAILLQLYENLYNWRIWCRTYNMKFIIYSKNNLWINFNVFSVKVILRTIVTSRDIFAKNFFRFRENFLTKIFAKVFAKMQNLLFSPHILIFWEHFCQLFYFKIPTLVNSIQSDAPFPKYSTSIIIPLLASILVKKFSRKFLHLRENCRIFAKISRKCVSALMASLSNLMDFFVFASCFAWFSHFRENWKMDFRFNPRIKIPTRVSDPYRFGRT
jgi:hypothetical protein